MSTSILPDDSIVVRLPDRTVHVDASAKQIRVRASYARADLGGSVIAAHDFTQVRRLRVLSAAEGGVVLRLELHSGGRLELGRASSPDVAMLTGRAVADLCRCQLDAGKGVGPVLGASEAFSEAPTFDGPASPELVMGVGEGVVPLSEPDLPAQPSGESEGITDEQPRPSPAPRPDSLHRVTREILPGADGAVFGALLRESEMASALDPRSLAKSLSPRRLSRPVSKPVEPPDDLKPTLVGLTAVGGRPEAIAELLALAAERLPVASSQMGAPARARSRLRPRPAS